MTYIQGYSKCSFYDSSGFLNKGRVSIIVSKMPWIEISWMP